MTQLGCNFSGQGILVRLRQFVNRPLRTALQRLRHLCRRASPLGHSQGTIHRALASPGSRIVM